MSQSKNSGVLIFLVIVAMLILLVFPMFRFGLATIFGVGPGPFQFGLNGVHGVPGMVILLTLTITFVWLLISIWVYNDAERNGMSGILWALLVFFGNVIALIIYLIVRSSSSTTPMVVSNSKSCPNCKGAIQSDFTVCPNCGTSLKNSCPKCGKKVQSGWKHCPYCGETL